MNALKIIATVSALTALMNISKGQTNTINIGIAGAINTTSLRGNEILDEYHHSGQSYSGELSLHYHFSKLISIRSGAMLECKSSSIDIPYTYPSTSPPAPFISPPTILSGSETFEYLSMPLLLRATFGGKINYFVNTGPYFGLLLRETTRFVSAVPDWLEVKYHQTSQFKRTEFGLSLGLGASYAVNPKVAFTFELRDNLGLTNISKGPVVGNGVVKTNVLNILCGLTYKLGQQ